MDNARSFYWACAKRAFSGKFRAAEYAAGALALFAIPLVHFLPVTKDSEDFLVTWGPVIFFVLVFCGTVFVGLLLSPWLVHKDAQERAEASTRMQLDRLNEEIRIAQIAHKATIAEANKEVFVYEFGDGGKFIYHKKTAHASYSHCTFSGPCFHLDGHRLKQLVADYPEISTLLSLATSDLEIESR